MSLVFLHSYTVLNDEIEILSTVGIGAACKSITVLKGDKLDVDAFRQQAVDETLQRQRFFVSREDGIEELKKDILSHYKDSQCKLKAKPRVRFEGEEGVGSGPVREFLLCAMLIPQDGISGTRRPVIFFEGEEDHLVPIHDQTLRCTGSFKAIGRIIGHSFIHGGPVLYGLSPAVKRYWALTAEAGDRDPNCESLTGSISISDLPDVDLRQRISQVQ
jgi:hypothetical protein